MCSFDSHNDTRRSHHDVWRSLKSWNLEFENFRLSLWDFVFFISWPWNLWPLTLTKVFSVDWMHLRCQWPLYRLVMTSTDLVREENSERSCDLRRVPDFLIISDVGWRQRQEDEARWNSDFGEVSHERSRLQATKRHYALSHEVHLTDQNVGGFRVLRQLLSQSRVRL